MPLSELGALLLFATAMAFTPGPNTTLSAAIAANRGLRPALRFVAVASALAGRAAHAELAWRDQHHLHFRPAAEIHGLPDRKAHAPAIRRL